MSDELFDLDVAVHVDGYEWVEAVCEEHPNSSPETFLVPRELFGDEKHYNPLIEATGLFREFSELDMSKEAILAFANEYGVMRERNPILRPGYAPGDWRARTPGETMQEWCESIASMKLAVRLWDMVRDNDLEGLSKHITWPKRRLLVINSYLDMPIGQQDPWLLWQGDEELSLKCSPDDPEQTAKRIIALCVECNPGRNASVTVRSLDDGKMQIYVRMEGLNDAVWFQFAQAVVGNRDYRQCRTCGKWYELHPDTARTNRLSCSDACRSKAYRQRKAEARRLFTEGIAVDEIARRLDTEPSTAHAWISSRRRRAEAK